MTSQPRKPRIKSALEHALLGLVAEVPGITGYDIVKIFDLQMAHYWHAHQGQIYPTLDRMVDATDGSAAATWFSAAVPTSGSTR